MKYKYFDKILDFEFCNQLINQAIKTGFKKQKVFNSKLNIHHFSDKRKSFVVRFNNDNILKKYIKNKLIEYNSKIFSSIKFIDNIRIIKYEKGGYFKFHQDKNTFHEKMFNYTMLIYLNHNYDGGNTLLVNKKTKQLFKIKKNTGSILIFNPLIIHSGSILKEGYKYILSVPIFLNKKININT